MEKSVTSYTTSDVARLKVKRERLKVWMEKGWIKPSVQVADGAGTKNLFNKWDLYIILIVKNLLEHGFTGYEAYSKILSILQHDILEGLMKDDFVAFFKGDFSRRQGTPLFYSFRRNDDSKNLNKIIDFYQQHFEVAVIINLSRIKEQVDNLIS